MEYRELGRTGLSVSAVGFGAWAIGGGWGDTDDAESLAALHAAVDAGVNFVDTADGYGAGKSEQLIGRLIEERRERIYVATKAGRRLQPHVAEGYTYDNLRTFAERSRERLGVDSIDLLQLHCPPTAVYWQPWTFEALERIQGEGIIRNYGVSVEQVAEARKALEYPGLKTIQIVFNAFRHKPIDELFPLAREKRVGIICRVPLASGLLTGKFTRETTFAENDHRSYNRHGERFDVGETLSGVDFEAGIEAAEEMKRLLPQGVTLGQLALRWILMHDAVSCAIPGARRPSQARENAAAADLPPLTAEQMAAVRSIYDRRIRSLVHARW